MIVRNIHTVSDLVTDLRGIGITPKRPLMVHSSMKAIGRVEGGAETVLDALTTVMTDGLLILPTHTWATMFRDNALFDPATEPSCVGILSNLFLKREGVVRSLHPTHSIAALGPGAAEFVVGEERHATPCPRDGVYGKLVDRNAQILFLGCPLTKNTLIHGVEEWAGVPNRLMKALHPMKVRQSDGTAIDCPMHGHDSRRGDVSENYGKLLRPFLVLGACKRGRVGDANAVIGDARRMADIATAFLNRSNMLFSDAESVPRDWY